MACACGCGNPVRGKFVRGHNMRTQQVRDRFKNGAPHPRWKGGIAHDKGYVWLRAPSHPRANRHGYVKRCILLLEEVFGPFVLPEGHEPHHKDEDKTNDDLLNLAILTHKEHARFHLKKYMPRHYRRPRRG